MQTPLRALQKSGVPRVYVMYVAGLPVCLSVRLLSEALISEVGRVASSRYHEPSVARLSLLFAELTV